ncbi:hypothetical protein HASA104033_11355 [Halobacterium salinarum]|uniref:Uncharacterized protein n=1 Tax=Halobacterium salinarum (strain ATCC 33171 / DSM 3754 / JCM 8978 / NBRC 102687 / NCIMB 764 / 91-R6) TaxID=2597657 RepID=A0A663A789_HALS9|nr:hypothetical protein APQ99_02287 [Halobacterium salinarum DSM 3754]
MTHITVQNWTMRHYHLWNHTSFLTEVLISIAVTNTRVFQKSSMDGIYMDTTITSGHSLRWTQNESISLPTYSGINPYLLKS